MLDRRWVVALACSLAINSAALAAVIYGISPSTGREPIYMEVSMAELFAPVAAASRPEQAAAGQPVSAEPRRETAAPVKGVPVVPLVAASTGSGSDSSAVAAPAVGGGSSQAAAAPAGPSRGPRAVYSPEPAYPEQARQSGRQGTVRLKVLIDVKGKVEDVRVATGSGHDDLDRAAVTGVREWRFSPALQSGQPIAAWVTLPVVFVLK